MTELALDILRCPLSHGGLRPLTDAERGRTGLGAGLVSEDGRYAYPVEDGVLRLLPTSALSLDGDAGKAELRAEKESVQAFYDSEGWQKNEDDVFVDTALFVDPRPRVEAYMAKCRARVQRHLPAGGRYLLDVASGPVHFPEYQAYSDGFDHRVCVDLSAVALGEARRNVGERGVYVVGDVTNLPFKDGSLDGVASLHTLYHVPRDEQANAFREIHRVLKPGAKAVVVYFWQTTPWRNRSPLMRVALLPGRLARRALTAVRSRRAAQEGGGTDLYYFAHDYQWFANESWPFRAEVLSWSSVNTDFLRKYVPRGPVAEPILGALYWLEERFPRALGRIGRYPMIVIRKG
jgi:ubiquinone/menaquinone biosynthesis C-methylase UbiE/uncharacterized protein YbaR (Trm112 family)